MSGCAGGHVFYGVPLQGTAGPSPTFLCPQRTWLAQAPLHSLRMGVRGSSAPVHGTCQPRGRPRHTWASGKASGFPRGGCTASTPCPEAEPAWGAGGGLTHVPCSRCGPCPGGLGHHPRARVSVQNDMSASCKEKVQRVTFAKARGLEFSRFFPSPISSPAFLLSSWLPFRPRKGGVGGSGPLLGTGSSGASSAVLGTSVSSWSWRLPSAPHSCLLQPRHTPSPSPPARWKVQSRLSSSG